MIGTATRPPAVLAAVSAPTPTPADKEPRAGASAHPFAEMLRQNRLADARAANPPPKASTTPEAKNRTDGANADDGAGATAPNPSLSPRDAAQSKARLAGASHAPARPTPTPARAAGANEKTSAPEEDDAAPTTSSADATASANPAAAKGADLSPRTDAPLGEQTPGAASTAGASAAASAARGLGSTGEAQAADAIASSGTAQGKAAAAGTESRRDTLASIADAAGHAGTKATESAAHDAASASFAEALAEWKAAPHAGASSPAEDRSHAGIAATAALAEPIRQLASPSQAPVTMETVPVPVDSPDFAAAFGMQVGSLARDGIQRAELHLNPTDMGPVSIQITLDGTQARVDFGADVAATRQAIEAGLPELASALRDAGFTLAGGGVTQHSDSNGGQADDAGPGHGGPRRGTPEVVARLDAAAQRATRRRAAGGVDLYA